REAGGVMALGGRQGGLGSVRAGTAPCLRPAGGRPRRETMRLPDLSRYSLPREPVRLARRAVRHVLGTLLGLLSGTALLLTLPLLLVRWRGPFRLARRAEGRRLTRFYRFRLASAPEEFLGGRRAALHGLLAGALGYVMLDLMLLVAGIVLGSTLQSVRAQPVVFDFSVWV